MFQAEKWLIVTDGTQSLPIFFDGVSSRRSIGNNQAFLTITAASGPVPGLPVNAQVTLRNVDFNHPGLWSIPARIMVQSDLISPHLLLLLSAQRLL